MRYMLKRLWKNASSPVRGLGTFMMVASLMSPSTATASQESVPKPAYRLGVFPYLPALTIDRLYGPLADSFSIELDRLVKLRTKSTFENFADAITEQSYDILFVHPFFYVDAVDRHGYLPLARLQQPLNAVLVSAEDGDARTLDDLMGRTIGLPPKLAAVSKLIKSALMDAGLRPGLDLGIRHFRNKASCLQAVDTGAVAACGVPEFILSQLETFARRPLRVIFEAPPVSHFAFAIHSRVPEEERLRLQNLVLSLSYGAVEGFAEGRSFVPIGDDDYTSIRAKQNRLQTLAQR
jgi:ABC-type phosphate/phosphonate transport system substrate-binding protein